MLTFLLITLGCGSYLMLGFLVWVRGTTANREANHWLSVFLLLIGLLLFEDCLARTNGYVRFPHLAGLFDWAAFALMPCLLLAIRAFVIPGSIRPRSTVGHLLPAVGVALWNIPLYVQTAAVKRQHSAAATGQVESLWFDGLLLLQFILYWLWAYARLRRHQQNIQQIRTDVEPVNLRWLHALLWGVLVLVGCWTAELVFQPFFASWVAGAGYFLGSFYIGFFAIRQPAIYPFSPTQVAELRELIEDAAPPPLPAAAAELKVRLTDLMTTQRLYTDNTLSLPQLAEAMHLTSHELSALINQGFGINFYQFVNAYRVEESKRLLTDPAFDHLSMIGIAFEAGFNSKTAFNTAFKATTGLSPSAYRKSHR